MAVSYREYLKELFQEHLEEAAFLYEQREASLANPELTWLDEEPDDARFEAHLDALNIGAELARDQVQEAAEQLEPGALHVAARLFCRQQDLTGLFGLINALELDPSEPAGVVALQQGIALEAPASWGESLQQYDFAGYPHVFALFLPLFQQQQWAMQPAWVNAALDWSADQPELILSHIGEAPLTSLHPRFAKQLIAQQCTVREAASWALLVQGIETTVEYARHKLAPEQRSYSVLACAASPDFAKWLRELPQTQWTADWCHALGLVGEPEAVPVLLQALAQDELALAAGEALFWITGQALTEEVFQEERWSSDELFPEELADFDAGKPPTRADGQPFGETRVQISTDPQAWEHYWQPQQTKFNAGKRYRLGELHGPTTLIKSLALPQSSSLLRQRSLQELRLRYGFSHRLNLHLPVPQQKSLLRDLLQQIPAQRFQPGQFYFQGNQL